jgi:hypothetical protein
LVFTRLGASYVKTADALIRVNGGGRVSEQICLTVGGKCGGVTHGALHWEGRIQLRRAGEKRIVKHIQLQRWIQTNKMLLNLFSCHFPFQFQYLNSLLIFLAFLGILMPHNCSKLGFKYSS